jgi:hypothetical protein
MASLQSFGTPHPVAFALGSTSGWLVLVLVLVGVASHALGAPCGRAATTAVSRLAAAASTILVI